MSFALSFNAASVAPNTGGNTVLETGVYDVAIVSSNEKAAKNTPGASYAEIAMQVLTGPQKGSKVTERLNLRNPSQQAVDIAYSTLSAICHVASVMHIQQTLAELHGKPFKIEITKRPREDKPDLFENVILRYLDSAGREAGQQNSPAPAAMAQPAATAQPAAMAQPAATAQAPITPVAPIAQTPTTAVADNMAAPSWAQ